MANRRAYLTLTLLITSLLLTSCLTLPDPETSQEVNREVITAKYGEVVTVGQTFIARRARLNGLTFWVNWEAAAESERAWVSVRLYHTPQDATQGSQPLFNSHISIKGNGPIRLALPPLGEPPGQAYYLELTPSESSVLFLGQIVDGYKGGQAFVNGVPLTGDLAFSTTYEFTLGASLSDLMKIGEKIWLFLLLALVLFMPGWLLLDLSKLRQKFDGGEQIGISLGLSLAVTPLLMLWSSTAGLRWNKEFLLVMGGVLTLGVTWRILRGHRSFKLDWAGISLVGIFSFTLVMRLMMVRDLVAPAWVDSVHHALITNLIMDGGGLPEDYGPYLELDSTVYHAGYHVVLAVFQWLSGLDLPEGMLLFGQVLNAACVIAVYLLTTLLTGDTRAGLWAALISGIFTPMPAYYVSWGRYTQLAGLLILPVPVAFMKMIFEKKAESPAHPGKWTIPLCLASLSAAGLLLVHYRAAAFLAALLVAYSVSLFFDRQRLVRPVLGRFTAQVLVTGSLLFLGTVLMTLPWMGEVILDRIVPAFSKGNVVPDQPFADFSWRLLVAGNGTYTLWLAGLGILLGMAFRKRFVMAVLLWVGLLFLLANLGALALPGREIINNTSVVITLFMPISLLGGYAISRSTAGVEWVLLKREVGNRPLVLFRIVLFLAGLGLSLIGARQLFPLLNQTTYLFRVADRPALAWIEQNIPQEEVILINPFNWGYGLYAGNDGGAWISALSGQPTLPPPVIYGFGDKAEIRRVNKVCAQVLQHGANPDELWALMQEADLHYVYTGVRGGPISPSALLSSPLFDMLYAADGAYVFRTLGWYDKKLP
jgi:hypothetical protein